MKNTEFTNYLPEVFQTHPVTGEQSFLVSFIKIFEALLDGRDDATVNGLSIQVLDETIERFVTYLDPALVPVDNQDDDLLTSEFLNFLASWVALDLDQNWGLDKKRHWLQKIVALYKKRGTKSGLTDYLNMFVRDQVIVEEPSGGFIVGVEDNSTIGINTFITDAPAYYFRVKLNYGYPPEEFIIDEWKNLRKGIRTIVDKEKPAHTYYKLQTRTPGIIVGGDVYNFTSKKARSTIGIDTLIWKESNKI